MKAVNSWQYLPYRPIDEPPVFPYICRIAPRENGARIEWLGAGAGMVFYAPRESTDYTFVSARGNAAELTGLTPDTDYEVYVQCGSRQGKLRLFRTGKYPGTLVNYVHPDDDIYAFSGHALCSPSFVRLANGDLLSSMDLFTGQAPQNLTLIFRSADNGETWHYVCDLFPCFWGRLFTHNGRLFMLSVSTEFGDLLIGESTDNGNTWCTPVPLLRGAGRCGCKGVHKNPQPMLVYNDRLWFPLEWGNGYYGCMHGSMPLDADPMDPASWLFSDPVYPDKEWPGMAHREDGYCGHYLEGCLTVFPDGKLRNILRYEMGSCTPSYGSAVVMDVDTDHPEAPQTFSHVMPFPGNHSKFIIQKDAVTGKYLSICSRIIGVGHEHDRNLLSLVASEDLTSWQVVTDLLDYTDQSPKAVGFQYVDWFIEGDDLLWLCRTAVNNARNFHDANCQTFHRISDFRKLLSD